jgi:predicted nucleic acid-binding protein
VKPLFFDTMVLSHFARADRLDVLRDLLVERRCWTTVVVRGELAVGVQTHPAIGQALSLDWMQIINLDELEDLRCFIKWANRLGSAERDLGEVSVLAAAELRHGTAITDDRDATAVARRHGADVHGTIWLLGTACRENKLTPVAAGSIVDALRAQGGRLPCTGDEFPIFAAQHGLLTPNAS